MNDTLTSPEIEQETENTVLSALFVSFHYGGKSNGVPVEGFDSRVLHAPADVKLQTADDLKTIANVIAESEFNTGRRFVGLEITILNIVRLPI